MAQRLGLHCATARLLSEEVLEADRESREALGVGFPGGTYTGLFYVADVQAQGLAVDNELHVDLEDAR